MGHKKLWKIFKLKCEKFKNWDQDNPKFAKEAHKIWFISPTSRIQCFESGSDELLRGWRLISQSGTQEVVKYFSNWNARNSRIGTKIFQNY